MNIFQRLSDKGYSVHNKRLLGNPAYTTQETKDKDFLQELGLVLDWFRTEHGIWIIVQTGVGYEVWWSYQLIKIEDNSLLYDLDGSFNTPIKSYLAAFDYILNNLI